MILTLEAYVIYRRDPPWRIGNGCVEESDHSEVKVRFCFTA